MTMNLPQADDPFVTELKGLLSECGINKNDHAIIGITHCIAGGIITRKHIMDTLSRVGLNPKHVVMTLNSETGSNPSRHRWQRDETGVYRNLN